MFTLFFQNIVQTYCNVQKNLESETKTYFDEIEEKVQKKLYKKVTKDLFLLIEKLHLVLCLKQNMK